MPREMLEMKKLKPEEQRPGHPATGPGRCDFSPTLGWSDGRRTTIGQLPGPYRYFYVYISPASIFLAYLPQEFAQDMPTGVICESKRVSIWVPTARANDQALKGGCLLPATARPGDSAMGTEILQTWDWPIPPISSQFTEQYRMHRTTSLPQSGRSFRRWRPSLRPTPSPTSFCTRRVE